MSSEQYEGSVLKRKLPCYVHIFISTYFVYTVSFAKPLTFDLDNTESLL
jgi:hypothetical protein